MRRILRNLIGCLLALCVVTGSAMAAEITPSVTSVTLQKGETTVVFDISLNADAAFAGAEFGVMPSDGDVTLLSCAFLEAVQRESVVKTKKNGCLYFGFFSGTNKFAPGLYPVARLTYSYSGSAQRTIGLKSSKIVTIQEENGTTVSDTSAAPFTVTITRSDSKGGGGGSVTPVVPPQPAAQESRYFEDVGENSWYYDAVQYVTEKGLFHGTDEKHFSPDVPLTRAMFATVLYRAEDQPQAADQGMFRDVEQNSWYAEGVQWAAENEIVSGYGNGAFGPDRTITREQIAVMLYRYAKLKKMDLSSDAALIGAFPDYAEVSDWSEEAMNWAVSKGILKGTPDGRLNPRGNATRGEAATLIMRFLESG